jgi:thiamine pyrophosphokinase
MICGSPQGISSGLLTRLAVGAQPIIAVDSGADWLIEAGILPDLLIGDLDSIDASTLARIKASDCRSITASAHKDFTDFDMALAEFASYQTAGIASGQLIITNVMGGRLDHELGALGSLARASCHNHLIVEDNCTAKILPENTSFDLGQFAAVGSTFSIIPLFQNAEVSVSGVEWELDHDLMLTLGSRGVSNVINSANSQITIHQGIVFVCVFCDTAKNR